MILLTQIIFHFGYARSSPLSERLATRLLGGTEALADSVLVQAARPEQRARMLEMRGPVRHASKMAAVFGARGRKYAFGANDLEIGGAASASAAEAPRLQKPPPLAVDSAPASASSAPASASPIAAPQTLGLAQLRLGVLLRDLGFTLSRHRLAALELELQDRDGSDGREAGITLNGLVYWYDGIVTQAVERELARHSGWRKYMPRLPSIPPIVRIVLAWLLVWAIFVALALVAVVYARVFGPATTQLILFSWCLGEFQSIAVQEPLLIILAALLPVLLVQSKFLSRCMETIAQSEENLSAFFVKNIKGLSGRLFSRCAGGGGRPFHAS
ncbi:hypothetical protein T492DRAFT_905142 [Pavlovales sp. CCMP2436]|nr:hypothetical protein T492DRAFT_905142 [Pavlovales sp. CCMP2436]